MFTKAEIQGYLLLSSVAPRRMRLALHEPDIPLGGCYATSLFSNLHSFSTSLEALISKALTLHNRFSDLIEPTKWHQRWQRLCKSSKARTWILVSSSAFSVTSTARTNSESRSGPCHKPGATRMVLIDISTQQLRLNRYKIYRSEDTGNTLSAV